MSRVYVFKIRRILFFAVLAVMIGLSFMFLNSQYSQTASGELVQDLEIHMVTAEYSGTTKNGQHIESYRWDPGTIVVNKGQKVKLRIFGVNGEHHPFIIEGLNIKDEVTKGNETIVSFTPEKEGTYRLICLTHSDIHNNGPMIGYIVVQ